MQAQVSKFLIPPIPSCERGKVHPGWSSYKYHTSVMCVKFMLQTWTCHLNIRTYYLL